MLAGSVRLTGRYTVPRPPRENLFAHLAERLGAPEGTGVEELTERAGAFLDENISSAAVRVRRTRMTRETMR